MNIPFNVPYLTGNEMTYIQEAVALGKLSGNGHFTQKCQKFFEEHYGFGKCLLTTSCTDALEMAAILANIGPGDEVIVPSYTFVSSALAFVRQGAKIVFADSESTTPNIDATRIEELITERTKAIIPVHYAGVACDMDTIMDMASRHNLLVIEDAAQAIDSYHISRDGTKRALGSIGHMAAFSFHETKNIISGEGGMLTLNDPRFFERSEIIWEKGTDRSKFFRGEIDKYGWVDTGSSFLPSEITAAFLWAQIEHIEDIQRRRLQIWASYDDALRPKSTAMGLSLPFIPGHATNNAHMYYVIARDEEHRTRILQKLKLAGINAVFHYQSLHRSAFIDRNEINDLPNADRYSSCLFRLPFYHALADANIEAIISPLLDNNDI